MKKIKKWMENWGNHLFRLQAVVGVLTWVGFLEFHEAYVDMPLRTRITLYAIHAIGLFYGWKGSEEW